MVLYRTCCFVVERAAERVLFLVVHMRRKRGVRCLVGVVILVRLGWDFLLLAETVGCTYFRPFAIASNFPGPFPAATC